MDYQTVEQAWCKVTASDNIISQGACWLNFEAKYPPGSPAFDGLQSTIVIIAVVIGFVVIQLRPNRGRQPPPRKWIDRF